MTTCRLGEELFAGTGGRTTTQGYTGDSVRQKFTSKERDNETGLDYFGARYYGSTQGRFTSIDPYNIVMETQNSTDKKESQKQFTTYLSDPRRWNRYVYCLNNPLLYTDPNGEDVTIYYRPPREGDLKDYGHFFIYVRNDETGESAYFDYFVEGGFTKLGEVDEKRLSQHASLTIETSADQEQAILGGIKEMQQSAPNYDLVPNDRNGISECTNNAVNLLKKGGIDTGFMNKFLPTDAWQSLFRQYAKDQLKTEMVDVGDRGGWRKVTSVPDARPGQDFGRDPRGQARKVDRNAINNRELRFRDGKRLN
jgi:RHS repeat-associated protein